MRFVLTVMIVALASPAMALPRWVQVGEPAASGPLAPEAAVTAVQNRFLPRIFGNNEDGNQGSAGADAELRIQQLESQVRMLTGQVEELTFTVRRLQSIIETGGAGMTSGAPGTDQRGAAQPTPGTGAPPSSLGQLPAQSAPSTEFGQAGTGPVDLSALNGDLSATPAPSQPSPVARNAAPVSDPALDQVRDLQQSGRFAMAADAARTVLTDNPTGPVAGEARFLLGEALFGAA